MRLAKFAKDGNERSWAGVVNASDNTVINLQEAGTQCGINLPATTTAILSEWEWKEKLEMVVEYGNETGDGKYELSELDRDAPISDPQKIICVGLNYEEHVEESGQERPERPVLFSKYSSSIIGPDDKIQWDPGFSDEVDYEAELVTVIGKTARRVNADEAREYVAGFTVGNDVSARDVQLGDGQWVRGKAPDTFAPIGPEIITADEVRNPQNLPIWTEVNGERYQDSNTNEMIFTVDHLVSYCSQAFTLNPGDLIFTGTPSGVGFVREPPVLLDDGDAVTVGIDGIGELTNRCEFDN